jgi:hypothetical protein
LYYYFKHIFGITKLSGALIKKLIKNLVLMNIYIYIIDSLNMNNPHTQCIRTNFLKSHNYITHEW